MTHEERFAAAERADGYAAAMKHTPTVRSIWSVLGPLAGMVGVGVFFGVIMPTPAKAPMGFKIGKVVMTIVMMGGFGYMLVKGLRFHRAPLVRKVGVVVDERTEVREHGKNSRARSYYYVTLQFRDGSREEYEASGELAGQVARSDIGVGYLKGERVVGFRRLEV